MYIPNGLYQNELQDTTAISYEINNELQFDQGTNTVPCKARRKARRKENRRKSGDESTSTAKSNNQELEYPESTTRIAHFEFEQHCVMQDADKLTMDQYQTNNDNSVVNYLPIPETRLDIKTSKWFMEVNETSNDAASRSNKSHNDDPIVGYSKEPLLPLWEACTPLFDILHNLSYYISIAIDETPEEPPDGLTRDESAAIRLYTIEWESPYRCLYSELNRTLKTAPREELRPYYGYLKLFLTALVKLPCVPPLTVWRGVTKDLSSEFPDGALKTWWGFSSCTHDMKVLENKVYLGNFGERTLFSLEAINSRAIRDHSHFASEDEVLLLPGTYMEVQSQVSPAAGLHIVHLKQLKPPITLLEPPFEDAPLYPPERIERPWYKEPRTHIEIGILISLCIAGIIVGAIIGSRRSPPPPSMFYNT